MLYFSLTNSEPDESMIMAAVPSSSPSSSIIIFFFVSVSLIISSSVSDAHTDPINCAAVKCGEGNPDIRFPFYCDGLQNQTCGLPGFRLSCNHRKNRTLIPFPEYDSRELEVKSISYDEKELILLDPTNCVHRVFLDLDQRMNLNPFKYYYETHNFTYLNCSEKAFDSSPEEVPCLSISGRHVYVVVTGSSEIVPSSCRPMKTVAIPFSYSHYLSDNSFGLRLTWDHQDLDGVVLDSQHEIAVRKGRNMGVAISIAATAVLILICLKYYSRAKNDVAVEKWMITMKMTSLARDRTNKMNELGAEKAKLDDNSYVKISVLNM